MNNKKLSLKAFQDKHDLSNKTVENYTQNTIAFGIDQVIGGGSIGATSGQPGAAPTVRIR